MAAPFGTYPASICAVKLEDFVKATARIYSTPDLASRIVLPVMLAGPP